MSYCVRVGRYTVPPAMTLEEEPTRGRWDALSYEGLLTRFRAPQLSHAQKATQRRLPENLRRDSPVQLARHHVPPFARSVPVCQSGDAKRAVRRGQPQERLASDDGPGTVALLSGHQRDPNGAGAAALPLPLQGPASWGQKRTLWRSAAAGPFFGVSGRMNWLPGPPLHQPFVL